MNVSPTSSQSSQGIASSTSSDNTQSSRPRRPADQHTSRIQSRGCTHCFTVFLEYVAIVFEYLYKALFYPFQTIWPSASPSRGNGTSSSGQAKPPRPPEISSNSSNNNNVTTPSLSASNTSDSAVTSSTSSETKKPKIDSSINGEKVAKSTPAPTAASSVKSSTPSPSPAVERKPEAIVHSPQTPRLRRSEFSASTPALPASQMQSPPQITFLNKGTTTSTSTISSRNENEAKAAKLRELHDEIVDKIKSVSFTPASVRKANAALMSSAKLSLSADFVNISSVASPSNSLGDRSVAKSPSTEKLADASKFLERYFSSETDPMKGEPSDFPDDENSLLTILKEALNRKCVHLQLCCERDLVILLEVTAFSGVGPISPKWKEISSPNIIRALEIVQGGSPK